MTYEEQQQVITLLWIVGITLGSFLLRKTPLGFLWTMYKWFWIILFTLLLSSYIKKEVKDWWNR